MAIEFEEATKRILKNASDELRQNGITGNFSRTENLHLTIKFLGEIDGLLFKQMCGLVKRVGEKTHSFVLSLDSLGKFEKGNRLILWYGLKFSEPLLKLHSMVENELDTIMPGLRERHYSPHITLVREARTFGTPAGLDALIAPVEHSFSVSGLSLMESARIDGRLTYIRRFYGQFES